MADTGNNRIVRYATDGTLVIRRGPSTGVTGVAVSGATVYAAAGGNVRTYTTVGVAGHHLGLDRGDRDRRSTASGNVWVSSSTGGVVRKYTSGGTFVMARRNSPG